MIATVVNPYSTVKGVDFYRRWAVKPRTEPGSRSHTRGKRGVEDQYPIVDRVGNVQSSSRIKADC